MSAPPTGRHVSPWVATATRPDLGDTTFRPGHADVVVLGAGVAGLTTALLVQRAGRQVTLLDAGLVGHGVTGHSTVKVTVGQGTVLGSISDRLGEDAARTYADANQAGLATVRSLVEEHGIDCDLEVAPHVVWTAEPDRVAALEREADLARRFGLPARLTGDVPLPFAVRAAVAFDDQVALHPVAYLYGLAAAFVAAGGTLLEGTRATGVSDDAPCVVTTERGDLTAEQVVVATHYPVLDRGMHFARLSHKRAYGVALALPEDVVAGMTISVDSPSRSTRTARLDGERLLVVVGESHPVGHDRDTAARWRTLADWGREHLGAGPVRYRWATQDLTSLDEMPYVGWLTPGTERLLTATGFAGWGMTNGTAAAVLLTDLLLGRENPWAQAWDARRVNLAATASRLARQNLHVGQRFVTDRATTRDARSPADLAPGEAAVLRLGRSPAACYRDEDGLLHSVSARCTHLGCYVSWNDGERSWDCPCHGSRFDPTGAVLHGPAVEPLAPVDPAG